jgi:uncharacterized membrane protein
MPLLILSVVTIVLIAGLFHIVPTLTRPGLFFAVTVAPEFRRTSEARRILRMYRAIVWSAALIAVALQLATGIALAVILVLVAGFIGALVSCHGRALAYAAAPSPIREVDLAAPRETLPGGPAIAALPLLFLGVLGLWTRLHWDRLPQRFPVHWGVGGADRWVTTTPATVFGFLALQASVCLLPVVSAWGLLHWSRRISTSGPGAVSERRFRRRILQLLIVVEYCMAFPAWFSLFQPSETVVYLWSFALVAVLIAFVMSLIRAGQGGARGTVIAGAAPAGDRTADARWKWGLVYINPADPSLLIEKRFGIGYTLNFGNRWSWLLLALILSPVAIAAIVLR